MKLSPFYNQSRDLAITVTEGARTVFSDPLSRSLFGQTPPPLAYNDKAPRLMEGARPYLLFRRELRLSGRDFALYAALPLSAAEAKSPALFSELSERVMADLCSRFLFLSAFAGGIPPRSSLSASAYFRAVTEDICAHLYAPLDIEIDRGVGESSVLVHRAGLSQAIGLALSDLLCEGQSHLCARLSDEDGTPSISLVGERGIASEFVRTLLVSLGEWSGFSVVFDERGVHFLLPLSHTPAAVLRSTDPSDAADLLSGFALLL